MPAPTVFISYSHDSEEHRARVLGLSERLRRDGIETILDQYINGSPQQGWPRWMLDQLDAAEFVLVVCTETYYRRFRGHEQPGKGKGVDWEGALITQELYDSRSRTLKFVPVFLSAAVEDCIPEPLRQFSYYALTSEAEYQRLYDFLLDQASVEPQPVGVLKIKSRRKGTALTFEEPSPPLVAKCDISRIIKYAPAELIGREEELKLLNEAWEKVRVSASARTRVLTFVALGGEGKTALVAKWAAELAAQDWPGCGAAFAWSFYSQGTREQLAASSDLFLKEALAFFGDDADKAFAASPAGAFEKGQRLARLVGQRRCLLILDGLEPLQYAPTAPTPGELKDQGLAALLKGLAAASHGLCVVTTRYSLPDLKAFWQTTAPEVRLLRLSREAGVHLLKTLGVRGTAQEFATLVEDVKGHALTLTLLGSFLRDAHEGDIRRRDRVKLEEADAEEQGGHAFHVMAAYERALEREGDKGRRALAVLRLLGLFDRPMNADCLGALLKEPAIPGLTEPLVGVSEAQRNIAFKRLEDAKLITITRDLSSFPPFPLPTSDFPLPLMPIRCCANTSPGNCARNNPTPGARPTGGSTNTFARPRRKATSPRSKTSSRFTKPWPTAARRGCSRRRVTTFTSPASCDGMKTTAQRNSARSVLTWALKPASSSNRGVASRQRSRKPIKLGC
jgi:hypothetical protein